MIGKRGPDDLRRKLPFDLVAEPNATKKKQEEKKKSDQEQPCSSKTFDLFKGEARRNSVHLFSYVHQTCNGPEDVYVELPLPTEAPDKGQSASPPPGGRGGVMLQAPFNPPHTHTLTHPRA